METRIKLGISACLLGNKVRFDGSHKWDRFLTDTLGQYIEYIPVCPEMECGFGVPREPLQLVGDPNSPHMITVATGREYTERMVRWARQRVVELEKEALCAFIFKSKSPSCGMERVKVYAGQGVPVKKGVGIFARVFMERFPLLPAEDEGRLHNPRLRENFIERTFTLKRWRDMRTEKENQSNLVNFHMTHRLLILAHSPKYYNIMGKLVARAKEIPVKKLYTQYQDLLLEALRLKTTPRKNAHVLHHIMGYFKKQLTPDEKQELLEIIDFYCQGYMPLVVPITLLSHYVRKYDQPYLKKEYYLHPYPLELQLRNHA